MNTGKPRQAFVLCVRNDGTDDLELWKVYRTLPDSAAKSERLIRLIDESGEDYLYPANYFVPIRLPRSAAKQFGAPRVVVGTAANKKRRA